MTSYHVTHHITAVFIVQKKEKKIKEKEKENQEK